MKKMRIGVYGGTFDPIHFGHLAVAETVKERFNLDKVVFIPSGDSYMKTEVTDKWHRYEMVRRAVENIEWAECSDIETKQEGPSYTADTMKDFMNKSDEYYWIMGADAFLNITLWNRWWDILNNAQNLVVVGRGDDTADVIHQIEVFQADDYQAEIHYVDFDYPISSTQVRKSVKNGQPYRFYVPQKVYEYIEKEALYMECHFNARVAKNHLIEWIRNKMDGFGTDTKAVIGISGGKDSTVVAGLCVEALGKDRVIGVMMPNGVQSDILDSIEVCRLLDIKNYTLNIGASFTEVISNVYNNVDIAPTEAARINLPARLRMTYLYAVAQTIGKCFVINTCNMSEDWVGYSTWHGDSAGDFSPLANYTSEEVMLIGDALHLPHYLTHKTPADGLCGKSDEDNLGFTYHELNEYIRGRKEPDPEIKEIIDKKHAANLFKLQPLDSCPYKG